MPSLCLRSKQFLFSYLMLAVYILWEKKKEFFHMQCSIDHSGNCVLHHCAAFLWVIHVVAEKIRRTLTQEFFQLVHKEDFNLLHKFWVHLGGDLQYICLFSVLLCTAGHCWQHPIWLENSSTVPWNGLQFYNKGG